MTAEITRGCKDYLEEAWSEWEGGFGAESGNESHGGYVFCAVAGLKILGGGGEGNLWEGGLRDWLAKRQMSYEGGFNGRSNKLVDNCYSFWVGGTWGVLGLGREEGEVEVGGEGEGEDDEDDEVIELGGDGEAVEILSTGSCFVKGATPVKLTDDDESEAPFDSVQLQRYILFCGQAPSGGLRDKPSKGRDYYHTCYTISGLSVAQWEGVVGPTGKTRGQPRVFGDAKWNLIERTHPVFNVKWECVERALTYFGEIGEVESWVETEN